MKKQMSLYLKIIICGLFLFSAGPVLAQWPQVAKLTASDAAPTDCFGRSVSLWGDYALIGADYDDDYRGSAYIFKWDGTAWTQQAKLTASDGASLDRFGYSLSLCGDYALIGAFGDDTSRGSAYVFIRNGTTWTQQAKLTASDAAIGDTFGQAVGISGNYAIIGSSLDDDITNNSGAAYIFVRNGTSWTQQVKLISDSSLTSDNFGNSVAIDGDYAIIGAYHFSSNFGAAYIYNRNGTAWTKQAMVTGTATNDLVGFSVSLSGNYALIGARSDDACGSAFIFKRDGTNWTQDFKLSPFDGASSDFFGYSVKLNGDYAIVGAPYNGGNGAAYLYKKQNNVWGIIEKIIASDGSAIDDFGNAVSMSPNFILIGSFWDDTSAGTDAGSAYIFGKCPESDLTGDCFVDFDDFGVFANQWLTGYQ